MNYRDVLYHDYSKHFGIGAPIPDEVHYAMFDNTYPALEGLEGAVVDLACGRGAWMRWMRHKGARQLTGVDLSQLDLDAVDIPGAELIRCDLFGFLRDDPRQFALIHAKDVIEHMTKDEVVEFLSLCRGRLLPGGQLWISTFNALAPMSAQTWRGDFTHEMAFTPSSMSQVMRACGFGEVRTFCTHPVPPSLKGRIRKLLMLPVSTACRFVAGLRYGAAANLDCRPTLVAIARNS